jgi:hypothetical protein
MPVPAKLNRDRRVWYQRPLVQAVKVSKANGPGPLVPPVHTGSPHPRRHLLAPLPLLCVPQCQQASAESREKNRKAAAPPRVQVHCDCACPAWQCRNLNRGPGPAAVRVAGNRQLEPAPRIPSPGASYAPPGIGARKLAMPRRFAAGCLHLIEKALSGANEKAQESECGKGSCDVDPILW